MCQDSHTSNHVPSSLQSPPHYTSHTPHHTTLHYTTPHHTTPHHTTPHHTTPHHTTPHHTTPHHTTPHHTTPHTPHTHTHHTTPHHTTPHHTTPHHTTPHHTTPHHTTLHYTTLHYTTLHYTTPHHITLHYTTLHRPLTSCQPHLPNVKCVCMESGVWTASSGGSRNAFISQNLGAVGVAFSWRPCSATNRIRASTFSRLNLIGRRNSPAPLPRRSGAMSSGNIRSSSESTVAPHHGQLTPGGDVWRNRHRYLLLV